MYKRTLNIIKNKWVIFVFNLIKLIILNCGVSVKGFGTAL